MKGFATTARRLARRHVPCTELYRGGHGAVWFAGFDPRGPSIAAYFCGSDAQLVRRSRIWRGRVKRRASRLAAAGCLAIMRPSDAAGAKPFDDGRSIEVPTLVHQFARLPSDLPTLHRQLLTSTTREDFRRIRRAGFSYRITREPDVLREFYERHYVPLLTSRFPDDGHVGSFAQLLRGLDDGGELICADLDGEWVAGIFNNCHPDNYSLNYLGIRDAAESVRQKRVVSALFIRSLERAVELGKPCAKYGRSLPFLGKGPVWFKAKWGGIIARDPIIRDTMYVLMDLRHANVRRMLAQSPLLHCRGNSIVASKWLEPGADELNATCRDAGRFPGVDEWFILGDASTLAAGRVELAECPAIRPIVVSLSSHDPIWLGACLPALEARPPAG